MLGRGWATPFDSKLTVATGKATYRADDGASFVFTQNSGGTYASPAGSTAKLVEGTSDYVLTTPDHTRRTFASGGRLTSVVDKAGKGLSLTYASGQARFRQGRHRTHDDVHGRRRRTADQGGPAGHDIGVLRLHR
ncbi:hypothetical protein [Streptomyces californicus]|uniref:hypothetical protein n=1 Tax=Streptomyces californicus TaxID=67351 RepID=UPI0036F99FED